MWWWWWWDYVEKCFFFLVVGFDFSSFRFLTLPLTLAKTGGGDRSTIISGGGIDLAFSSNFLFEYIQDSHDFLSFLSQFGTTHPFHLLFIWFPPSSVTFTFCFALFQLCCDWIVLLSGQLLQYSRSFRLRRVWLLPFHDHFYYYYYSRKKKTIDRTINQTIHKINKQTNKQYNHLVTITTL